MFCFLLFGFLFWFGFFKLFIYLFIWLHQVLVAACRIFVVAYRIFRCDTRAFSLVAVCGLLPSCDARAPECAGSVVVAARRLSCLTVCGILVPQPGIEPASRALEGRFLTTGPPGKSLTLFLDVMILCTENPNDSIKNY